MSDKETVFYKRNLAVPFFTQRDNTYVWQQLDDDNNPIGDKYPMAWRTCNITSLCMILHYWGLTKETPNQMIEKVFSKEEWGWSKEAYEEKAKGAARVEVWENLKAIAEYYISLSNQTSFTVHQKEEKISIMSLQKLIAKGFPVMLSCGLASLKNTSDTTGHVVVVRGFTDNDDVILNDPFGSPVDNNNSLNNGSYGTLKGCYYNSPAAALGDNIVIKLKDFEDNFSKSNEQYLYIEGPLWQQPGGTETDLANSYPIRADNMWHDGIHLESTNGFYSIGAGRLVAARNAEVKNHGSCSFAIIKYQMPEKNNQFFYALYMHLKKIDMKQELEDFFLKNNGTVSEKLRNTWYEQIFSNLLPTYGISYYSEKSLNSGQQEDIYEAEIINKKIRIKKSNGEPVKAKLDNSNTGIESRHMKYYMLPPEKLYILCDIENYKNISKLKFMLKKIKDDKGNYSSDFIKDGYLFFYCGNNSNRELCCIKTEKFNLAKNWQVYNEPSYKYYTNCLYKLYKGESVIFNKIDTSTRNDKLKNIVPTKILNESVLEFMPVYYSNSKFLLGVHSKIGFGNISIEQTFHRLKQDIQAVINDIEFIFITFVETGKSASEKTFTKYIDEYKDKRKTQLENFLKEATRVIGSRNAVFGSIEKKTDVEWMKELFEDAEKKIDTEKVIAKRGNYDVTKGLQSMREEFKKIFDEYQKSDLINSIAICEFLMVEFASLPKEKLIKDGDRFKFESFSKRGTFYILHEQWSNALNNLIEYYMIFFKQRYIDNYIEIPKGAKIGEGSDIPDTDGKETDSIHFEVFSKENLFAGGIVVEDDANDNDTFYSPSVITNKIISALNLPAEEQKRFLKYSDDNVITKNEIEYLYKESDYFKKMVTYHRSEWKTEKYRNIDIEAIANKKRKVKNEILKTIDYYNNYYSEYNWLDKKMENEIGGDKFYYYHPTTFINFLYSELTNKYILNIYSFSSKPAEEQYALLYSIVHDESLSTAEKGILASELRKERETMKLEDLFDESDETKYNFMNKDLRDFLNLKEDGTMDYKLEELCEENGWHEMPSIGSMFHQNNAGKYLNAKYVNDDGREVVLDNNREVVLDELDKGTFNYGKSTLFSTLFGNHKKYDVAPYNKATEGSIKCKRFHLFGKNSDYWTN